MANEEGVQNRDEPDSRFDNRDDAVPASLAQYNFLQLSQSADLQNQSFIAALQRRSWQNNYRAYRNQHVQDSKYLSPPYRNRSKLVRPKIRKAVRDGLAAAGAALFSTADVVSIEAEHDSDPVKQSSAVVLRELLNYRLDRAATKSGVPWFQMAMGACLDSQLTGVCCAKIFWEYEVVQEDHDVEITEEVADHQMDEETGTPVYDQDGNAVYDTHQQTRNEIQTHEFVTKDRPMVLVVPPELAMVDPAAPWYDPAQLSGYFIVKWPMTVEDVKTMMQTNVKSRVKWLEIPDEVLTQAQGDYSSKGVRIERAGGADRYDNRHEGGDETRRVGIVWMFENFMRVGGVDYHYWSVGDRAFASTVQPTRASYPEQFGARPYTYGYGAIETHNIAPMSAAEQILPLHQEATDLANLRLDTIKQSLSPIAVVRQGSLFDWKQLQHRGGADTTITVRNPDDLRFERLPDASSTSYQEHDRLNVDIDALAGTFDSSSINANRGKASGDTVGGMRLLTNGANAIKEFDLRVWVETWVETTLRQVVRAIQYYENDDVILSIAGDRAKFFEKFGISQITDRDLETEVSVRVNVGIGAADPLQKLQKLAGSMKMIQDAGPFMKGLVFVKPTEFIKEVMGPAGYNDGTRFFDIEENMPSMGQLGMQVKIHLEQMKQDGRLKTMLARIDGMNEVERMRMIGNIIDSVFTSRDLSQQIKAEGEQSMQEIFANSMLNTIGAPSPDDAGGKPARPQPAIPPPQPGQPAPGAEAPQLGPNMFGDPQGGGGLPGSGMAQGGQPPGGAPGGGNPLQALMAAMGGGGGGGPQGPTRVGSALPQARQ